MKSRSMLARARRVQVDANKRLLRQTDVDEAPAANELPDNRLIRGDSPPELIHRAMERAMTRNGWVIGPDGLYPVGAHPLQKWLDTLNKQVDDPTECTHVPGSQHEVPDALRADDNGPLAFQRRLS
jgi:hypothetical protein